MSDEQPTQHEEPKSASSEAWQEVGQQFQALGESLAAAFRTAWHDEENRRRVQEMQAGLEAMVKEVGQAIKESAAKPQVQQVKGEAQKAAESLRAASEQTAQEVRPHLLSALRQLNDELQKLIGRMEQDKPVTDAQGPTPPVSDVK
jgi:vacuolar-type H+-ATPase subunit I/STV1